MAAHSYIGASGAKRWKKCTASAILTKKLGLGSESSIYSKEGTAAHTLMAKVMDTGVDPMFLMGTEIEEEGDTFVVDQEMADAVELFYGEYLNQLSQRPDEPHQLYVETEVQLDHLSKDAFGTVDLGLWFPESRHLVVIDFKYGAGIKVEATGNDQIRYYMDGLRRTIFNEQKRKKNKNLPATYEAVIVQPRAPYGDTITREALTNDQLVKWRDEEIKPAIEMIERGEVHYYASEECKYCPALAICRENRAMQADLLHYSLVGDPEDLDGDTLGILLTQAVPVEMFIHALRGEANKRLARQEPVTGWKHGKGKTSREWKPQAENYLVDKLGEDAYSKPTLLSPAQIEKLPGGKEIAAEAGIVETPGRPALVKASDSRPSYSRIADLEQSLKKRGIL